MPRDDHARAGSRNMTVPAKRDKPQTGVVIDTLEAIGIGDARGYRLATPAGHFRGFVVRTPAGVRGYVDRCPHMGLPLARKPDAYLSPDRAFIACGWHGALFDPDTGQCRGGPCLGAALSGWPVHIDDGRIVTGPASTGDRPRIEPKDNRRGTP